MLETKNFRFYNIQLEVFYSDELVTREELQSINERINLFDISLDYDNLGGVGGPIPTAIDLENIFTVSFKPIIEGILSAFLYDVIKSLVTDLVFRLKQKQEKVPVMFRKDNENIFFFFDPKTTSKEDVDFYLRFTLRDSIVNMNDDAAEDEAEAVSFKDNDGEGKG